MRQDLEHAWRLLIKNPGFTAVVVISLALGIGANTAIFSLLDAVMWRTLPVKDPAGLWVVDPSLTYQQYRKLADENRAADLAAYATVRLSVSVNGAIEPTADGQLVTGGYFSLLGVGAAIGRTIGPEDDRVPNGHPVAMISNGYWNRRFGRNPAVLGQTLSISGSPFTIIGVTPPEFFGVEVGMNPDVFVPVMMQPTAMPAFENLLDTPIILRTWLTPLARLKPGIQLAEAQGSLQTLWRETLPDGPRGNAAEASLKLAPAATGLSSLRRQFSQPLFVLMVVVGVVLLIACANTANLLLARAAARRQELAMRLALGASRWRLTRQLLLESTLLALLGGVSGILIARWATQLLVIFMSSGRSPINLDLNPNLRVLAFTAAVSVATGMLFGLAPAVGAARLDLWPTLRNIGGAKGRSTLRPGKVLAVFQVALSLLVLIAAGLFTRSLQRLSGDSFGVSRDSVLVVRVEPRGSDQRNIPGTTLRLDRTYRELLQAVRAIPGVRTASVGQSTPTAPLAGAGMQLTLPSGERLRVPLIMLYSDYFSTMGIPLAAGREFDESDLAQNAPSVCMVNEAFVRQMFPGENPIGRPCFSGRRPNPYDAAGSRYAPNAGPEDYRIVGIVKDSRYSNPRGETQPVIYTTFLQTGTGRGQMVLHVRVAGDASAVMPRIRDVVLRVDPSLPAFDVHTLAQEMDAALVQERLIAMLSTLFGGLALLLASVGLYGLLTFGVVQRTSELGLRMALGARPTELVRMVIKEAMILVLAGIALGVPVALIVVRLAGSQIAGLLFRLTPGDPWTIAIASLVLVAVAAIAASLPALRSSRVNPLIALKAE
jgi:putative ABC transport system permease protein